MIGIEHTRINKGGKKIGQEIRRSYAGYDEALAFALRIWDSKRLPFVNVTIEFKSELDAGREAKKTVGETLVQLVESNLASIDDNVGSYQIPIDKLPSNIENAYFSIERNVTKSYWALPLGHFGGPIRFSDISDQIVKRIVEFLAIIKTSMKIGSCWL